MNGSMSLYECRICHKPLWYLMDRHVLRSPKLNGRDVLPEGTVAPRGLVYFHETDEETNACLFALQLARGART